MSLLRTRTERITPKPERTSQETESVTQRHRDRSILQQKPVVAVGVVQRRRDRRALRRAPLVLGVEDHTRRVAIGEEPFAKMIEPVVRPLLPKCIFAPKQELCRPDRAAAHED